jgi:hypothetical protein
MKEQRGDFHNCSIIVLVLKGGLINSVRPGFTERHGNREMSCEPRGNAVVW